MQLFAPVLQQVAETGVDVVWTHIGSGPGADELLATAITQAPDVEIRFLGSLSNEQVLAHYRNEPITVLLNLSSSEGVPVSIMEAMSLGIPVVATAVGGTAEAVIPGRGGVLVDRDDSAHEMAAALIQVWDADDAAYRHMCAESRTVWSELCDMAAVYPPFVSLLTATS